MLYPRGEAGLPGVVLLEGSPREMGLAHGRLLAREIRFLVEQIDRLIFRKVDIVRGTGIRVLTRALASALNVHLPERFREELRGVATGSGVAYPDLLLMNSLDDVLNILRRFAPRSPSLACSSFALFGKRTWDGSVLHGRNLDYHFRGTPLDDGGAVARLLLEQARLFVYRPVGRSPFVSIAWPGVVAVSTAMNGEGICLGSLTSYLRGTTPLGTPATAIYRRIAEEAGNLEEAGEILRACRRTIGNNLLVSSGGENRAALFEIAMNRVAEVPPDDGMLVTTNHFLDADLARHQRPYLLTHSVSRWERLQALCDREGVTVDEALTFLADVACVPRNGKESPFARVANEGTAVSVLFQPAERALWIGTAPTPPASSGKFERADIDALLEMRGIPPATSGDGRTTALS